MEVAASHTYPVPVQGSVNIENPFMDMVFYSFPGIFKYMVMFALFSSKTIL